ncbi:MAG: nucleoside deaminase [Bacteroidales bacterium]|nr:nucleoside deaminase [Bacteroidales bacterium]
MNDIDYMRQAYGEALEAYEEGEIPVGAVVVCDGQVIASAHNETERLCDVTAHAEMLALTAAANELGGKYLNECTLYVTLEPCIMCAGATGWAQVKRLVYGASDEKRGYTLFAPSPLHPKTEVTTGVMKEECEELMKKFFREKR